MPKFDELGREINDPTPVPHRSQVTRVGNLMQQLQEFIQGELSRQAAAHGQETEEEANDFEDDDVEETWTAYEEEDYRMSFPDPSPAESTTRIEGTAPGGATPSPTAATPDGGGATGASA